MMLRGIRLCLCGLVVVAVTALWTPRPVAAQIQPAGELRDMCFGGGIFAGDLKEKAEGLCWGFIAAVSEILIAGNMISGITICPPLGGDMIKRDQVIAIVKRHLDGNREDPAIPGSVAVAMGLAEAFPCE